MGLDPTYRDTVAHAILAHHGRHEWGSPVAPATPEATVIHFADMLSRDASYDKHPG
jgi:3'-5' exoribonuclease